MTINNRPFFYKKDLGGFRKMEEVPRAWLSRRKEHKKELSEKEKRQIEQEKEREDRKLKSEKEERLRKAASV